MSSRKKLNQIAQNSEDIGNKAYSKFKTTNKLKYAKTAIRAYNCSIRAQMAQNLINHGKG